MFLMYDTTETLFKYFHHFQWHNKTINKIIPIFTHNMAFEIMISML